MTEEDKASLQRANAALYRYQRRQLEEQTERALGYAPLSTVDRLRIDNLMRVARLDIADAIDHYDIWWRWPKDWLREGRFNPALFAALNLPNDAAATSS